jgi:type II secretory pathway pseudopilin PulG
MSRILGYIKSEKGMTLLEIIITFIIASFLGTLLVEYMGTSLTRGGESVIMVQDGFSISGVMEKITVDYEDEYLKNSSLTWDTFKSNIENGNVVTNTPYYGEYTVQAEYIVFTGGAEASDLSGDNLLLKVVLSTGYQSVTALFRK